ncbi:MAG: DUF971 domain-containing protein [Pseudomonadaceae bacterium]|nr:DUF971 domain-containing protein [Pseudomonadaceae bacterium]
MSTDVPTGINYRKRTRELVLTWADGSESALAAELLRVYSPSAEVRGHGVGERKIQVGKKHVRITEIEATGNYAVRLVFDDGHDTGLYTWGYLKEIADNEADYWQRYLKEMKDASASRLPTIPVGTWQPR